MLCFNFYIVNNIFFLKFLWVFWCCCCFGFSLRKYCGSTTFFKGKSSVTDQSDTPLPTQFHCKNFLWISLNWFFFSCQFLVHAWISKFNTFNCNREKMDLVSWLQAETETKTHTFVFCHPRFFFPLTPHLYSVCKSQL